MNERLWKAPRSKSPVYLVSWNYFVLANGRHYLLRSSKRRVKSIGELKSEQIGQHEYRVTLGFIYGTGIESPIDIATLPKKERKPSELPPAIASRLSKQLGEIRRAVTKVKEAKSHPILATNGEYYFRELDEVIRESNAAGFAYRRAGMSLVLGAIRVDGERSSERAFRKLGNLKKKLDPALDAARSILDPSLNDNCIFYGTVGYADDGFPIVLPGTIPLMWWPLLRGSLHDLVFGKVVAFSLYNPAHFWELLRSKGYTVVVDSRSRFVNATKKEGGRILQLGNMDYFRHLTSNFLMSDETVAKMLDKVTDELEKQKEGTRIKVDLNPRMKLRN